MSEKVRRGGGDNAIARHTQRNKKLLIRDRLRLLLDDEDFLELSPFAGLGLLYGDIPSAACMTGQKTPAASHNPTDFTRANHDVLCFLYLSQTVFN